MLVTQHACHTALYRMFEQSGVTKVLDQVEFHRLDAGWQQSCGLRRADLLRSISEFTQTGLIVQRAGTEGAVIELTDRGSLQMARRATPFRTFRWSQPIAGLNEALNTASILLRAHWRSRRLARNRGALVRDRRSQA